MQAFIKRTTPCVETRIFGHRVRKTKLHTISLFSCSSEKEKLRVQSTVQCSTERVQTGIFLENKFRRGKLRFSNIKGDRTFESSC